MYRNYNGAGAAFSETHVRADSSDQGTLIVINKTGGAQSAAIGLAGFVAGSSAAVYRYSAANLGAIVRAADQAVSPNGFSATLPAESISLFHPECQWRAAAAKSISAAAAAPKWCLSILWYAQRAIGVTDE